MDLKEVVRSVRDKADEAHRAFHAGHPEKSNLIFMNIVEEIRAYFVSMSPKEVDALQAATIEETAADQNEKPAQVPGAALPATQFDPAAAAQQIGKSKASAKPNQ